MTGVTHGENDEIVVVCSVFIRVIGRQVDDALIAK